MSVAAVERQLDVRGLNCPLPLLHTQKALAAMASGECLRVVATDRGALTDIPAFASRSGNVLVSISEEDGSIVIVLRRR